MLLEVGAHELVIVVPAAVVIAGIAVVGAYLRLRSGRDRDGEPPDRRTG